MVGGAFGRSTVKMEIRQCAGAAVTRGPVLSFPRLGIQFLPSNRDSLHCDVQESLRGRFLTGTGVFSVYWWPADSDTRGRTVF